MIYFLYLMTFQDDEWIVPSKKGEKSKGSFYDTDYCIYPHNKHLLKCLSNQFLQKLWFINEWSTEEWTNRARRMVQDAQFCRSKKEKFIDYQVAQLPVTGMKYEHQSWDTNVI